MSLQPINPFSPAPMGGGKPPWTFILFTAAMAFAAVGVGYAMGHQAGRAKSHLDAMKSMEQMHKETLAHLKPKNNTTQEKTLQNTGTIPEKETTSKNG